MEKALPAPFGGAVAVVAAANSFIHDMVPQIFYIVNLHTAFDIAPAHW
jgi:hypothetical protein